MIRAGNDDQFLVILQPVVGFLRHITGVGVFTGDNQDWPWGDFIDVGLQMEVVIAPRGRGGPTTRRVDGPGMERPLLVVLKERRGDGVGVVGELIG